MESYKMPLALHAEHDKSSFIPDPLHESQISGSVIVLLQSLVDVCCHWG